MKNIYILADSVEDYHKKVKEYVADFDLDVSDINFNYLSDIGQIDHNKCEIWDCSNIRQSLGNMGCTVLYDM